MRADGGAGSPAAVWPERVVAIAALPRSGSTLLSAAMRETGLLGDTREHFNAKMVYQTVTDRRSRPRPTLHGFAGQMRRRLNGTHDWMTTGRYRPRTVAAYLDHLAETTTSPNGVLSVKTMWPQFEAMVLSSGHDLSHWDVPVTWIRTTRDDVVRQAISLERANQTGQWTADAGQRSEATYDAEAIRRRIATLTTNRGRWDDYLDRIGATPLTVTYEQLDSDYEGTVASVFAHLGVDATVPPRQLERQADTTTEEWLQRFLADDA